LRKAATRHILPQNGKFKNLLSASESLLIKNVLRMACLGQERGKVVEGERLFIFS
jgi:hypothetical protein